MNQADFAKLHGVSRKTVTTWKARGWLVMEGDEVNVEASNANIELHRKTVTPPEKKKRSSVIEVTLRLRIEVTADQSVTVTATTTNT
jgi:ribosomal protein L9